MLSTPLMLLFMLPSGDVAKVQAQVWDSYSIGAPSFLLYVDFTANPCAALSLQWQQ